MKHKHIITIPGPAPVGLYCSTLHTGMHTSLCSFCPGILPTLLFQPFCSKWHEVLLCLIISDHIPALCKAGRRRELCLVVFSGIRGVFSFHGFIKATVWAHNTAFDVCKGPLLAGSTVGWARHGHTASGAVGQVPEAWGTVSSPDPNGVFNFLFYLNSWASVPKGLWILS